MVERIRVPYAPPTAPAMHPSVYRGRLAPSPTGYLHLGHARTFQTAQERAGGGTLVLRIEDLDAQRCRPEYVAALEPDLRGCGLAWQEGPFCQSERLELYRAAWRRLIAGGAVYPCRCSRRDVQAALGAPHAEEAEPIYPGTCRGAAVDPANANWRFAVAEGEAVEWLDGAAGPQRFMAGGDFGDFLVWRRDGVPAYQLAVVVDDAAMGITEVVRGADLLVSTAQQILLYRALGFVPPGFYHCPLVCGADGRRLAKRRGAHSLRDLREAGEGKK